jgi:hypothetical protein
VFSVFRSGNTIAGSTVKYRTRYGNSSTGVNDLAEQSGTVSFGPGETIKQLTIYVKGDTQVEVENVFFVDLSSPTNAVIGGAPVGPSGLGRIVNDDGPPGTLPTFAINDVRKAEGDAGQTPFVFTVTHGGSTDGGRVQYRTQYGNDKTSAADLPAQSGTVSFAPGQTSRQVTILVNGDANAEVENVFYVDLFNPVGGIIADARGVGTIVNDD